MLILAGIGPGNRKLLTIEVEELIKEYPAVIAFKRVAESFADIRKDIVAVNTMTEMLEAISNFSNVLVLASGDVCFYGILELFKHKDIVIDRVLCGISSVQYMASKLALSWHNAELVSLHGRECDFEKIKGAQRIFFLTDKNNSPNVISKRLYKEGFRGTIYAGYDLSYENEYIEVVKIGDTLSDRSSLAVVVIENEHA